MVMEAIKTFFQKIFGSKTEVPMKKVPQELDNTVVSAEYRSQLTGMADRLVGMFFWNKGEGSSKLTVGLLISRAAGMEEVVIYSHSLGATFYKDVLRELKCPARILLDDSKGMSVVECLPQNIQNLIDVHVLSSPRVNKDNVHFIATDYAFRCGEKERDDELSGWASFNNPIKTKSWRDHFDKLWKDSVPCLAP